MNERVLEQSRETPVERAILGGRRLAASFLNGHQQQEGIRPVGVDDRLAWQRHQMDLRTDEDQLVIIDDPPTRIDMPPMSATEVERVRQFWLSSVIPQTSEPDMCDNYLPINLSPSRKRVLFIGEAPGRKEIEQNVPFVGRSGVFLRDQLAFDTYYAYINTVNVWPHGKPTPEQIAYWRPTKERDLAKFDPQFIICLGRTAIENLYDGEYADMRPGESGISGDRTHVFCAWHPSFAVRFNKRVEFISQINQIFDKVHEIPVR